MSLCYALFATFSDTTTKTTVNNKHLHDSYNQLANHFNLYIAAYLNNSFKPLPMLIASKTCS